MMLRPDCSGGPVRSQPAIALLRAPPRLAPDVGSNAVLWFVLEVAQRLLNRYVPMRRQRMLKLVVASNTDDEHPLAPLRNPIVRSQVESGVDRVARQIKVRQHPLKERLPMGHQQSLDILRDEYLRLATIDHFDHSTVQDRTSTTTGAAMTIDGYVLAGKTPNHYLGGCGQRVHDLVDVALMKMVASKVRRVRTTRQGVDIIRPHDVKRQGREVSAAGLKSAEKPQVHTTAPRKERHDAVPL